MADTNTFKGLVDQWGRPIRKSELTEELAGPTVAGVRQYHSGHPAQGLTPPRLASILREAEMGDATRYLELAEEMEEKDLHYLGVLGTRKRQVAQLEINVIAASDDKHDQDNADLIRDWLGRDEIEDELFDILDSVGKGYSVTEIMWQLDSGQWMPERLEFRDPRWFRFDPDDGKTLRLIDEHGQLSPLAPYKFIRHVTRAKSGLPIRGGLARAAAWGYLFKNFTVRDWVIFVERYGHPLRLGRHGPNATDEEKKTLLRAVTNIASDAAAIIPQGMEMEFIEAKISGNMELFERFADWIDRQISKAVLGQTLTTEVKGGSFAAAKVHGEVKDDIERSDAKDLSATLNRDLVRPIVDLNRGVQKRYPKIRIGRPDEIDVEQFTKSLAVVVPMGLKVSAKDVRDKLNFKEPDGEDDVLHAPGAQQAAPQEPQPEKAEAMAMAAAADNPGTPDAIESFIEQLAAAGDLGAAFEPLAAPLEQALETASSFEEFQAALIPSLAGMNAEELAKLIARATFQARIAGAVEADLEDSRDGDH
ncbi:MAG: DUF935 domain-containing protein [Alphaproteobacteria bacterium]|nr:DUF935 domain-containing protein [Alphaproteobacteria bacterium]